MKKLTISAFCMCLCILGCLTGCDSGLQSTGAVDSLEINGWTLASPEGEEAIKNYSASEVEAVKNIEYNGSMYVCTVKGNAASVLDRVRDPLFGCMEVNYEDPTVQDYLKSFNSKSVTDVEKKYISIEMSPVIGPNENSRYALGDYFTLSSGMPEFNFGVLCSKIYCDVIPQSPNMQFTLNYEYRDQYNLSGWKSGKGDSGKQIFSGMGTVRMNSKFVLGWWQWKVLFSVTSGGSVYLGFNWYGAVPKAN